MDTDRIEMSQRERDFLKVMAVPLSGRRTQAEADRLLQLSVRQVRRIQRRLEPSLVLLVVIDDATSKVVTLFYPAESTESYFDLLGRYLRLEKASSRV